MEYKYATTETAKINLDTLRAAGFLRVEEIFGNSARIHIPRVDKEDGFFAVVVSLDPPYNESYMTYVSRFILQGGIKLGQHEFKEKLKETLGIS